MDGLSAKACAASGLSPPAATQRSSQQSAPAAAPHLAARLAHGNRLERLLCRPPHIGVGRRAAAGRQQLFKLVAAIARDGCTERHAFNGWVGMGLEEFGDKTPLSGTLVAGRPSATASLPIPLIRAQAALLRR